jgi:hypothetical protein
MPLRLDLLTKWKELLRQRIEFTVVTPAVPLTHNFQTSLIRRTLQEREIGPNICQPAAG